MKSFGTFCLLFLMSAFTTSWAQQRICMQLEYANGPASMSQVDLQASSDDRDVVEQAQSVDYNLINATIRESLKEVSKSLRNEFDRKLDEIKDRMSKKLTDMEASLESYIQKKQDSTPSKVGLASRQDDQNLEETKRWVEEKLSALEDRLERGKALSATDGRQPCTILYKGICYWFVLHSTADVSVYLAKTICTQLNSELGHPVDEGHYEKIMSFVRSQMPITSERHTLWTGLEIEPAALEKTVTVSNGTEAPFVKWAGRPSTSKYDVSLWIIVRKNPKLTNQGMINDNPAGRANGVICRYKN